MRFRGLGLVLLRFVIAYGLLVAPWPGWRAAYARLFRAAGPTLLAAFWPGDAVRFVVLEPRLRTERGLDTQVLLRRRGSPDEIYAKIDSRRTGYLPIAFFVALVYATPAPRSRRVRGLLWGLIGVHLFVAARISALLAVTAPGGSGLVRSLQAFLSHHLWTSGFVVVLCLWILTTVRLGDWDSMLQRRARAGRAES